MRLPADATLIVIDAAEAVGAASAGSPAAQAALLAAWRGEGLPIVRARAAAEPAAPGEVERPGEFELALGAMSAFRETALESLLEEIGATTLVLCGAAAKVAASARDAAALGYQVYIVADACGGGADVGETLAPLAPEWAMLTNAAAALAAARLAKFRERWKAERSPGGR